MDGNASTSGIITITPQGEVSGSVGINGYTCNLATNGKATCNEASDFTKNLKVGDLVQMTPTVTSVAINLNKTGVNDYACVYNDTTDICKIRTNGYIENEGDYVLNPSELNLWRVIRKNSDGTVDMVSDYLPSTNVIFYGVKGYANYVGYLNELASYYENPAYTVGSRHTGFNGQTEYITDTSMFDLPEDYNKCNDAIWLCSTGETCDSAPVEALGGGDTLYTTDEDLIKAANNNEIGAYIVGTNNTSSKAYFLASRRYRYSHTTYGTEQDIFKFMHREAAKIYIPGETYVIIIDGLDGLVGISGNSNAFSHMGLSCQNGNTYKLSYVPYILDYVSNGIRPIITLRSDVTSTTGNGTAESHTY